MKKLICIATMWVAISGAAYAVDLDSAPQPKKVTVRSEIERGKGAAMSCGGRMGIRLVTCLGDVFQREKTNNTDTDAFILGASFVAWWFSDTSRYTDLAKAYYDQFHKIQLDLGIDDKTLCKLCGLSESILANIPKYQSP